MTPDRAKVRRLLHRNVLGKLGAETWGDWADRTWRRALCRVLGHGRPAQRFSCVTCTRCHRVIG